MTENEFNVLFHAHKNKNLETEKILFENRSLYIDELKKNIAELKNRGWLSGNEVTSAGYAALKPYKVDNAIIMAAGRSSRCLPLSQIIPKGLFSIRGEIMLEREIEQLKDAGVNNIILVVGYLKEKFFYLKDKYNITILENPEYDTRNNIHSLYIAKEYMKNSYICCSDNYFRYNVFRDYVYDSYYACKYSREFIDEFCVTGMRDGYIAGVRRGDADAWYTMGEAYFNRDFSADFVKLLVSEYDDPEVHRMLMDNYHIRHIDVLKLRKKEYDFGDVKEFDTLNEITEFDNTFTNFIELTMGENYVQ